MTIDRGIAELEQLKTINGGDTEMVIIIFDKKYIERQAIDFGVKLTPELYHEFVERIESYTMYSDDNPVSHILNDHLECSEWD